jgi:hypothetical protein
VNRGHDQDAIITVAKGEARDGPALDGVSQDAPSRLIAPGALPVLLSLHALVGRLATGRQQQADGGKSTSPKQPAQPGDIVSMHGFKSPK